MTTEPRHPATPGGRILAEHSVFLVVDIQGRLLPAIADGEAVLAHTRWLAEIARAAGIPCLLTEQYPAGLGPTEASLAAALGDAPCIEKIHFSAVSEGKLLAAPGGERQHWVVTGTEAHVCVQQTVLDLLTAGRHVHVVEEGVGSRQPRDKALALQRMAAHGAAIVSREMVAFEWLARADTPLFRQLLASHIR